MNDGYAFIRGVSSPEDCLMPNEKGEPDDKRI